MFFLSDVDSSNYGRGRDKAIRKKRVDRLGAITLGALGLGTLGTTAYYGMKGRSTLGKVGIGAAMLGGGAYGYHRTRSQMKQKQLNR